MIYRLRYCNKDGVEARVDIQKGSSTPIIEVEGTERPFVLSYNNDKGNKSGMFLSSSADIEIYETTDFNINNLKTSNETELSVTHYINNVVSWQGFIIPDFFSIEVRNNPVITMTASDRLGTLKNVTLSDLPSMISLRELAILCLNKTGLSLPLKTMADFNNGTGINDFFNSKILTQRLSDTKGRSISCYDILSSILTASNSFLVQRSGGWHIINKIQHEAGSGKLYTGATSFINWADVIFNFSDISIGGRRTIIPVASTVGVFHEFGGGRLHPENYDFLHDLTGWNPVGGFVATIDNRKVDTFTTGGSGGAIISPVYGDATEKKYLVNNNEYVRNVNPIYLESDPIPIFYKGPGAVNVSLDINAVGPSTSSAYIRVAIIATNGTDTKILDYSGNFIDYPDVNPPVFTTQFNDELAIAPTILKALSKGLAVSGKLEVEDDLSLYSLKIRLYGGGGGRYVLINSASVIVKSGANDNAKGIIYKVEREDNYTKAHEINTSLFADYLTTGLNGYFYDYSIDDTSSLYNSANELTSKWTAYNDTEQLPLLQHVTRQKSRLFSVAHDLLSAEIEASNFDPLAIFVACEKRYTVVSAQFDFFKSNLSVELEEVAFQNATVRDFIYSYFGDGESGIKSIGGISGGGGGGSTGGGLTPEQLEILSWWKKDPDNPNTIFTEMNAYSKLELSAYGAGDGGGGGGGTIETVYGYGNLGQTFNNSVLTDTFNAYTINQINTRLVSVESGSATTVNTTGTGNAITSISKSGTIITASKDLTFSLSTHLHTGVYEPVFTKNSAFNKNFGTASRTVAQGNDSRILNGQTAFGWGNHASAGYALNSAFNTHNNDNVRHITGAERTKWDGVVTDFAGLEIGGRNLILNSNTWVGKALSSARGVTFERLVVEGDSVVLVSYDGVTGDPFFRFNNIVYELGLQTYSVEAKLVNGNGELRMHINDRGVINHSLTEQWERYYCTADNDRIGGLYNFVNMHPVLGTGAYSFYIRLPMLTKGNKSYADWTPAPEDQVSDWSTTDVNSFSFIKNKPTTLAGYGITDAVTLNTAQTISGAKIFSSDIRIDKSGATLYVRDTALLYSGNQAKIILGRASDNAIIGLFGYEDNTTEHLSIKANGGSSAIKIFTGNSERVRISAQGYVGIGATSPSEKLHVVGNILATGTTTTTKVIFNAAGWSMEQVGSELQMKHNNVLKMRFTSTGSIVATEEITAFG